MNGSEELAIWFDQIQDEERLEIRDIVVRHIHNDLDHETSSFVKWGIQSSVILSKIFEEESERLNQCKALAKHLKLAEYDQRDKNKLFREAKNESNLVV